MKAVILVSGGLDSATTLYYAKNRGYDCECLTLDYGQRHIREIDSAEKLARSCGAPCRVIKFDLPWGKSSLLDRGLRVPKGRTLSRIRAAGIPNTYVPARNTIFLSFAVSYAESVDAGAIFIGANAVDFSGYPDCRPEYYKAFKKVISRGTKAGALKKSIKVITPLITKTKSQIIKMGKKLGVPYELTWSCYSGGEKPCLECDSCLLRAKGFREAGFRDPLIGI
ncbi:MAG: 7-cyano-7-deazaguanine synthase QueC [Candidatus Omnitrophota bacterium]